MHFAAKTIKIVHAKLCCSRLIIVQHHEDCKVCYFGVLQLISETLQPFVVTVWLILWVCVTLVCWYVEA